MKKALLLSTLLTAAAAHAQDGTFTLGAGIGAGTRYSGADEYLVSPVIVADYQAANGFYASTLRGIGFAAGSGQLSASVGLGYRGERRENRLGPGADAGEAGESIQFVYGPVAFNPRGILRDPLSARQSGLALVAGAGIDSIQRQARLIKLAIVHTTILETPRVPGARVTLS